MLPSFVRAVPLFIVLGCVTAGAAEPTAPKSSAPPSSADMEHTLRDALALPADTRMIYQAENGAPLTVEQFVARVNGGAPFEASLDKATKTATARLKPKPTPASEIGSVTQLPPFDLHDLYGRRIRNLDLAGRPTLINFFDETCVPCIKEAPVLNTFRRRHAEFNYLAVTPDSADAARRFVEQRQLEWPVAFDAAAFLEAAKVKGFPTYLLVAADGRILGRGSGMDPRTMDDPAQALGEFEQWVSARLTRRE